MTEKPSEVVDETLPIWKKVYKDCSVNLKRELCVCNQEFRDTGKKANATKKTKDITIEEYKKQGKQAYKTKAACKSGHFKLANICKKKYIPTPLIQSNAYHLAATISTLSLSTLLF